MHRRTLLVAARTTLLMLVIAAVALSVLGAAALVLPDPPESGGWLRVIFGRVFAVVAFGMAAIIGAPAAIGLSAMAGAAKDGAVPTLPIVARRALAGIAIVTVAITAVDCLTTSRTPTVLDLGVIGLVALASLGLAGAASFSPHRWRAILSALALLVVAGGTLWVLTFALVAQ
jgi:hypothetical protein